MNNKEFLMNNFNINENLINLSEKIEENIYEYFKEVDDIKEYNHFKVLNAMISENLSDSHFHWPAGYGYNDVGREKTELVYAKIFNTEDALVRPSIANGTHALSISLRGILNSGDTMLSITGKPYDTLDELIGIHGDYKKSFKNTNIRYEEIDFLDNGEIDLNSIKDFVINNKTKLIYIQRSTGYHFRNPLTIATIKKTIDYIKSIDNDILFMVDNCYGEFLEKQEPTDVGADIMAGSLIKNPGGGIVKSGGYVVGSKDIIKDVSFELTSPGIGKECGVSYGEYRNILQGLFLAPLIVSESVKGGIFASLLCKELGYEVKPQYNESRSDIILSIKLNSEKEIIDFCKGIQSISPINSYIAPIPGYMPGYESDVIMAAGTFIEGSSIELSSDAPIRKPYIVYFQGGLLYNHSKIGILKGLSNILN